MILHHSRRIYSLITTEVVVPGCSLLSLSAVPYNCISVFLSVHPMVWLLLLFLHSSGVFRDSVYVVLLSIYTIISVRVYSFLVLGVDHVLYVQWFYWWCFKDTCAYSYTFPVNAVMWRIVSSHSLSLIYILHCTSF